MESEPRGEGVAWGQPSVEVQTRELEGYRGVGSLFLGDPRFQYLIPMQVLPNASLWKPGLQSQR